jgi:DNA polymerase I-like protein with 3'-5' exonuclease and polymerase domains
MHNKVEALPGHDGRWIPSASEHSALNTLLQGNGSIVMKKALVVFDEEMEKLQLMDKIGYCANVHDEFQITTHPDVSSKVAEIGKWSITRAGELLEVRCPLVGDASIGKTWADTH